MPFGVMKTPAAAKPPTATALNAALGPAVEIWRELIAALVAEFPSLREVWKDSKIPFGKVCLIKQKERTLLYLLPRQGKFEVAVVLGERAYALAMASDLPSTVKSRFAEARSYAEGRGIRWEMNSLDQVPVVRSLMAIKTAPK